MFFSVRTRNLNWEILTKNSENLAFFERWDGVKDEMGGSLKNLIFFFFFWGGEGFLENQYIGGGSASKEGGGL